MSSDGDPAYASFREYVRPPRYPISPTNKGGYAVIAAVIMIAIAGMAVAVKLHITATTFRKMRRDDGPLLGALVLGLAYTVAICESVNHGLGRAAEELTNPQVQELSQYYLAANVLLWLSLACSKCAIALLIIAIEPARWIKASLYSVCGVSIVWAIVALCLTAVQCGPTRWVMGPVAENTCLDQYAIQIGIRIVDILTDIALAVLPGVMMLGVQVPRAKKLVVSFIFGLRLITPIFAALALADQRAFYNAPTRDRPFEAIAPSVWASVSMGLSLVTACIPSIKRFLMDWAAGVSNNMVGDTQFDHTSYGKQQGQAFGLRSFTRSHATAYTSRSQPEPAYSGYAHGRGQERDGMADDGDSKKGLTEGIIQTTDVHVQYEEEQRRGHHGSASSELRSRI